MRSHDIRWGQMRSYEIRGYHLRLDVIRWDLTSWSISTSINLHKPFPTLSTSVNLSQPQSTSVNIFGTELICFKDTGISLYNLLTVSINFQLSTFEFSIFSNFLQLSSQNKQIEILISLCDYHLFLKLVEKFVSPKLLG